MILKKAVFDSQCCGDLQQDFATGKQELIKCSTALLSDKKKLSLMANLSSPFHDK
jgi:hypothetical protein